MAYTKAVIKFTGHGIDSLLGLFAEIADKDREKFTSVKNTELGTYELNFWHRLGSGDEQIVQSEDPSNLLVSAIALTEKFLKAVNAKHEVIEIKSSTAACSRDFRFTIEVV